MEVKIYVDVLFIINFIIDFVLLSITSLFVKKSPGILRLCIGSFIGAAYASTAFFVPLNTFFSLMSAALVAFLMIFTVFGSKKALTLLKDTTIFYLIASTVSGMAFGVVSSGHISETAINNGIFYANIDAYSLLAIFVVTIFVVHIATGKIKKQKIKSSFLYNVTIEKNNRTINDIALFDSGNFMSDPISQKNVIIAEWKTVAPLFDEEKITEAIINNPKEFLYIGCQGIGGVTGLYAFSPDKVTSHEIDMCEPVLVAVTENHLDKDDSFHIILPNTATIQSFLERI